MNKAGNTGQQITTRDYCRDDIPELAALTVELGYPTTSIEMAERINFFASNPDYKTIVAELNSIIIGYIGMIRINYWEKNGCYIKIQALVVKETARKTGAGKVLIKCAEEWARQNNADMLALTCGNKAEREAAHKFYPKMGFVLNASGYVKLVGSRQTGLTTIYC